MREIKFRFVFQHDTTKEIVVHEYTLDQIRNGEFGYPDHTIRWDLIAELQFTGLKDKNGKDIYEGDLVAYDVDAPMEIVYKDCCFTFKRTELPLGRFNSKIMAVTGNIYEK